MTYARVALLALAVALLAGCGGSSSSTPTLPTIEPAKTFALDGFKPAGPVTPGKPVALAFTIRQPNGEPLTDFKRGSGPHTGVHVIVVSDDLSSINHQHPPIAKNGRIDEQLTFPRPGKYRVVVDAYPNTTGPQRNFQLFQTVKVSGKPQPQALPPFKASQVVDGYRFTVRGNPKLKAIQASFLTIDVTKPDGKPAEFTPWYGALAHAIFFRKGSLAYFHTHVCAPGASGCTSVLGGATVSGSSSTPGKLTVGVLVPVSGTWRLFLQTKVNGQVLTAPFTLKVQ
ncbi:MAG TPA: hypothetical protein VGF23_05850 [Gaiellaceae bacterium]